MKPINALAALALSCLASHSVFADGTFGKFTYTETETSVTISDYPEEERGPVNIPASINGKPVTTIGLEAFMNCRKITKVTLPESITRLDDRAFYYSGVNNVNLPDGLTSMGQYAFFHCGQLLEITIPGGLTEIGPSAFNQCSGLESVTLPDTMSVIPVSMFAETAIRNIQLPGSLGQIDPSAFRGCEELEELTIPPGVKRIGNLAFKKCGKLKRLTFSEGLKVIGLSAFSGCESLTSVTFPSTLETIKKFAFRHHKDGLVRVTFLGNAPGLGANAFKVRHASYPEGFQIYYKEGAEGFTSPEWNGYPAMAIKDGAGIIVEQPLGIPLQDASSKKSFGSVISGKKGGTKTFTVRNGGSTTLTGLAITVDGPGAKSFKIEQPNKTTVAPGEARIFKVTFKPSSIGNQSAVLHVSAADAQENPFDIKLGGFGVGIR